MYSQNTVEWEIMRKNKIGASDAPIIMEVSPYKTPFQLWQQKLDLCPPEKLNYGMIRGHEIEDKARRKLEEITDKFFLPQVKFHPTLPWMMASLDCVDTEGKYIAEIKLSNKEDHQMALDGKIPEKHFPQLQHQLEVAELDIGHYFSVLTKKHPLTSNPEGPYTFIIVSTALVNVYRDNKYIKGMLQKEKDFWDCVQSFTAPALIDRDYEERRDQEWMIAAQEWLTYNKFCKEAEIKEKEAKDRLISMAKNKNCKGGGVKFSSYARKGSIDYESIPELQGVNLESYRKNPTQINIIKPLENQNHS